MRYGQLLIGDFYVPPNLEREHAAGGLERFAAAVGLAERTPAIVLGDFNARLGRSRWEYSR